MGMPFLQCFKHESQLPPLTEDASTFCSSLADDLERLVSSLANDSISLKWSFEAMSLLKRMQKELLTILKKSTLPISYGTEEDWFEQYMKDSATLLDFCNSLKIGIAGINRYRMIVDFVVQKLGEENSSTLFDINKLGFESLDKDQDRFLNLSQLRERIRVSSIKSSEASGTDEKSLAVMMLASKTTMIVLSLLLVSAVFYPIPNNMRIEEPSSEFPELKKWMEMLTALVCSFYRQIANRGKGDGIVLAEHEMVEDVVEEMRGQATGGVAGNRERILNGLQRMRRRSFELREGVERFDDVVNEVFDEVIRGRTEMLEICRNN